MIIAGDGPVAAGKGTLARRLAEALRCAYLDTGSTYRAVAAKILVAGGNPEDPATATAADRALQPIDLERDDPRLQTARQAASTGSATLAVRAALLAFQRRLASNPPPRAARTRTGPVMAGRANS